MPRKVRRGQWKTDTKRAIRRSFHPRELIIPSEKLEDYTAKAIHSGWVNAKTAVKRRKRR